MHVGSLNESEQCGRNSVPDSEWVKDGHERAMNWKCPMCRRLVVTTTGSLSPDSPHWHSNESVKSEVRQWLSIKHEKSINHRLSFSLFRVAEQMVSIVWTLFVPLYPKINPTPVGSFFSSPPSIISSSTIHRHHWHKADNFEPWWLTIGVVGFIVLYCLPV